MNSIFSWLQEHTFPILLILGGAYLARRFGYEIIKNLIHRSLKPDHYASLDDEQKREDTLLSIVKALGVVIYLFAGMMILSEVGLDIGPLVAGAGIAGVALGFGGQWLVRDLIAGLFIILENQFRVGDVVEINAVSGKVVNITLRKTILRDLDGNEHHVPNGSIEVATNMSKEYSNINLDVGVGYNSDLKKVKKVINDIGIAMGEDPEWQNLIIEAPYFLRVNDFGDSSIEVKIMGKTKPLQQWAVTGELRYRLKVAFDKHEIEIPFPQRVIHTAPSSQKKSKS